MIHNNLKTPSTPNTPKTLSTPNTPKKILAALFLMLLAILPASAQLTEDELDRYAADTVYNDLQSYYEDQTAFSDMPGSQWAVQKQAALDRLLEDKLLNTTQLGLMVYDLTDQRVVYRVNERQRMRPASTQKLVSAITALDMLGGNYRVHTYLRYSGDISGGVLRGNLYCIGGMDPTFTADDMKLFVEAVRNEGITRVEGKVVADKSMKDDKKWGEGWCWDDDNPILSPLLVDRKDQFAEVLLKQLRDKGVTVTGGATTGRAPQRLTEIADFVTPLDLILKRMMKNSDNLYAESVFYQVAAGNAPRPVSARQGAAAVKRLIQRLGLPAGMYVVADGSGLSLYDFVTPELMVRLLKYAYEKREIYDHLRPVLPLAGVDGTLKNRMQGTRAQGNVHAKTGTVTSVSALAGYLTASNGHLICFSIINQGVIRSSDGRGFQDRVCEALCR